MRDHDGVEQVITMAWRAHLDALGAATYSESEIRQFLESRQRVLSLFGSKADAVLGRLDASRVSTYTFNDTVVVAYELVQPVAAEDVTAFGTLLRHLMVKSIANGILFRGAISLGGFYSDEPTNTIMGKAVSDAAACWTESGHGRCYWSSNGSTTNEVAVFEG